MHQSKEGCILWQLAFALTFRADSHSTASMNRRVTGRSCQTLMRSPQAWSKSRSFKGSGGHV